MTIADRAERLGISVEDFGELRGMTLNWGRPEARKKSKPNRQSALPPTLAPRLINRDAAAAYVNVSPNTFDKMVDEGTMPKPKGPYGKRQAWDVRALDAAVDDLPTVGGSDSTWDD
jgi:predicted DNA-binding transcriptional regulator AlpA